MSTLTQSARTTSALATTDRTREAQQKRRDALIAKALEEGHKWKDVGAAAGGMHANAISKARQRAQAAAE
jgi:hypothetical protein